MENTATSRKVNFRKFINDCYVEHNIGNIYNVVWASDYEVGVCVDVSTWTITENDFLTIDNDAKRELLFSKIDAFMEEERPVDVSTYEHPSVAGGLYSNSY